MLAVKRNITIKDIAKELGISTSTVSRALSGQWDVNSETRQLVMETARRMNYHPNPMAVKLITRKSKTIGMVIPEFQNSFFPNVISGVQNILDREGYQLLITQSNESSEIEERNIRLLESNMVDGIIISVTREGENYALYQDIIDNGTPIVFFNRVCEKTDAPKVVIDDYKMSFFAVEHLIYSGYKNIAHLTGPESLSLTQLRKKGYIDALKKHKFEIDNAFIVTAGVLQEKGFDAMTRLLDSGCRPDAVFCFNDPVAIGAMKAIKSKGLRIPQDIALVGYSESRSALLVEPNLTSIAQPMAEMGETVANLILKKANNQLDENPTICLTAKLNIRESSKREI